MTTKVDNSVASTGDKKNTYAGVDTNDKVFLLSRKEVTQYLNGGTAHYRVPTEYAVARGAYQYTGNDSTWKLNGKGVGWWWLRSPHFNGWNQVQGDTKGGYSLVFKRDKGVVPALKIKP